jgi:hypothetical protein
MTAMETSLICGWDSSGQVLIPNEGGAGTRVATTA